MQKLATGAAYQFTPADGYTPAMGRRPAVLIVHGWGSTVFTGKVYFEMALRLQAIGYHTMMLSLRGHQGSLGDIATVTREQHQEDILAALHHLSNRPEVAREYPCGFGASYGGYLLACIGFQFNLLVLRAPALYPDSGWVRPTSELVARPDRVEWRAQVRTLEESHALMGINDFEGKLLVIGSEQDEDMPPEVLASYKQATPPTAYSEHIISGAGHRLNEEQLQKLLDHTGAWFTEHYPR